jgi:hypothetical protein
MNTVQCAQELHKPCNHRQHLVPQYVWEWFLPTFNGSFSQIPAYLLMGPSGENSELRMARQGYDVMRCNTCLQHSGHSQQKNCNSTASGKSKTGTEHSSSGSLIQFFQMSYAVTLNSRIHHHKIKHPQKSSSPNCNRKQWISNGKE